MSNFNSSKKTLIWLLAFLISYGSMGQTQLELLQHWAPEVYQDVNASKSPWITGSRQYYTARDIPVKIDFDDPWYTGNNWDNSHYQVWEQGKLNNRKTPPLYAAAYSSFVETGKFYFLGYGYYHAGDDSNLSADRHENDWEMVTLCVKKDGSKYGAFQGMLTQFHSEHKEYDKNFNRWNGTHPKIYISANGTFDLSSPYEHGHGIEAFTNSGYQKNIGGDAIVFQVADFGENVKDVKIPGDHNWDNARRYKYKLISINELWAWRNNNSMYSSYTTFRGGTSLKDGGNPPWGKGYFTDPLNQSDIQDKPSQFASSSVFKYLHADIASDKYIYNPYFKSNSSQKLNDNPNGIVPWNNEWAEAFIGNGKGKTYFNRETFIIDGLGDAFGNASDNGYFLYKVIKGNTEIKATVDQVQWVYDTKAGIMIRESLDANSKNVFVKALPNLQVKPQYRESTGGNTTYLNTPAPSTNAPVHLKLTRNGNKFSTYYSTNGEDYTLIETIEIEMAETVYVGLANSSTSTVDYSSSMFYNVSVSGNPLPFPVEADFSANKTFIPVGAPVTFTDMTLRGPDSWSWEFEGGTPATSNEQNPTVTYKVEGTYKVALTASNTNGTDTEKKVGYIYVYSNDKIVPGHVYTIENVEGRKYFDVSGISNDDHANIHQWEYTDGANQKWQVEGNNGVYILKAQHSGKCADVEKESKNNGANIQQYGCNGKNNQKWKIIDTGDGNYKVESVNSGKVLDVDIAKCGSSNGCNIHQWDWHGGNNQRWIFKDVTAPASTARAAILTENNDKPTTETLDNGQNGLSHITIAPNPVHDAMKIVSIDNKPTKLAIYDFQGKLAYAKEFTGKFELHKSKLNGPGMYFVKLCSGEKIFTEKILIK